MKPFVVISALFVLFAIAQIKQQSNTRIDSCCPAKRIEVYANPQGESSDTIKASPSGKLLMNGLIIL
jgi:hypothetical protein